MNKETMSSRIINTLLNRSLNEKIFFLHIPKCGGTSLDRAIKNAYQTLNLKRDRYLVRHDSKIAAKVANILYDLEYTLGAVEDYPILKFREEHLAYLMCNKKINYISGHFVFNPKIYNEFKTEFTFITMVRDPVKKWLSNYYYRKYRNSDHWKIDLNISDYLNSERGIYHGYDYPKYFGGLREDTKYESIEAIENAKNNLCKFHIIGCLEYMDDFIYKFKKRFGVNIKIGRKNVSPKKNEFEVSEDIIEKIKQVCKPDLEIYNYVKENFVFNN